MNERVNLQDQFLNNLRKDHTIVSMFLVNGIKLVGRIESFDQYMVLLRGHDTALQAVFKHAISTVSPARAGGEHPGGGERTERRSPYGIRSREERGGDAAEHTGEPREPRRPPVIRYK